MVSELSRFSCGFDPDCQCVVRVSTRIAAYLSELSVWFEMMTAHAHRSSRAYPAWSSGQQGSSRTVTAVGRSSTAICPVMGSEFIGCIYNPKAQLPSVVFWN